MRLLFEDVAAVVGEADGEEDAERGEGVISDDKKLDVVEGRRLG